MDELGTATFVASATDADGDPISYQLVEAQTGATIDPATGAFAFTPTEAQGPGVYTFSVIASDGTASDSKTVTVSVGEVNSSPTGAEDSYIAVAGERRTVAAPGVVANDADPDLPKNALTAELVTGPANGTLAFSSDGSFAYTPNPGYLGSDSFAYRVSDGKAVSAPATVLLGVQATSEPTALSLSGPAIVSVYGGSAKLTARLQTGAGLPIAGQTITFERWTGSAWASLAATATDSTGAATVPVSGLKSTQRYWARFAGASPYSASDSTTLKVVPAAKLTRETSWTKCYRNRTYYARGFIEPRHSVGDGNKVEDPGLQARTRREVPLRPVVHRGVLLPQLVEDQVSGADQAHVERHVEARGLSPRRCRQHGHPGQSRLRVGQVARPRFNATRTAVVAPSRVPLGMQLSSTRGYTC